MQIIKKSDNMKKKRKEREKKCLLISRYLGIAARTYLEANVELKISLESVSVVEITIFVFVFCREERLLSLREMNRNCWDTKERERLRVSEFWLLMTTSLFTLRWEVEVASALIINYLGRFPKLSGSHVNSGHVMQSCVLRLSF